ncbi:MAG: glycosyltransferase family 2 protein [Salinibacter sp.]|uniref:glycosyltransferase family 2 protein n=1 Tax=Salinibacter sp. TaxID=2065818 RepID=UPI0035D4B070
MRDVSLIIKTFERQQVLERLLDSIAVQGYADCPILVADDSREPYRDAIVEQYGDLVDEYLVLPFNSGVSKGRNELLERVDTRYFVLNDDDFVYGDITDLETARRELVEHDLDILGGQLAEKRKSYHYDWIPTRVSNWIGLYSEHWEKGAWVADIRETSDGGIKMEPYPAPSALQPCDLALQFFIARTSAVRDTVGGWNPKLKSNGEHWEFFYRCKQAGLRVASSQRFGTYHVPKQNERYEKFRYGKKRDMITRSLEEHGFKYLEKEHRTYHAGENDGPSQNRQTE